MKVKLHDYKIAFVAASPQTVISFLNPHIIYLSKKFTIDVLCSNPSVIAPISLVENIHYQNIEITRKINVWKDIVSLLKLICYFAKSEFDLVHSITPKAGLLAMMAAYLCGVRFRVHIFTGQVWANKKGLSRQLLKITDRLTALTATHILADSKSQRDYLIKQGVVTSQKIAVLGCGSVCGVDLRRFSPNIKARAHIRKSLGIDIDSVIAIFVGRLTADKGIFDLVHAFSMSPPELNLMIVGADEEGISEELLSLSEAASGRLHLVPHANNPEDYMAAADFICLPSYREGFGSVIIEGAGVGLPAIASRIYGITDAVEDGITGFLHEPGSIEQITNLMTILSNDAAMRIQMGERARSRAYRFFSSHNVVMAQMIFYDDLFKRIEKK